MFSDEKVMCYLEVDVAEGAAEGAQGVLERDGGTKDTEVQGVGLQGRAGRGEHVVATGDVAGLEGVEGLPDPVDAVDHGVVEEEGRVGRGGVEVAGLTTNGEVAGGVHAEEAVGEAALELVLEVGDGAGGAADGDVEEVGGREPLAGSV